MKSMKKKKKKNKKNKKKNNIYTKKYSYTHIKKKYKNK